MFKKLLTSIVMMGCVYSANAENGRHTDRLTMSEYIADNYSISEAESRRIIQSVQKHARLMKIDPKIVFGIIRVESGFDRKAYNRGSYGLMQIQKKWHRDLIKGRDLLNIDVNIEVGTKIFKNCMEKHRADVKRALLCYNGGGDPFYPKKITAAQRELNNFKLS